MLVAPPSSSLDLGFPLGRIPVRVSPTFWLGSALLGLQYEDPRLIFVWVVTSFISILIHELGHALVMEAFGARASIVLYHFGGLAVPDRPALSPGRALLISLAGPALGFLFYGQLLWLAGPMGRVIGGNDLLFFGYGCLLYQGLMWNLLNLLPIYPLDGGQALLHILELFRLQRADLYTVQVSTYVAGAAALWFGVTSEGRALMAIVLFGMLCFENLQRWIQWSSYRRW